MTSSVTKNIPSPTGESAKKGLSPAFKQILFVLFVLVFECLVFTFGSGGKFFTVSNLLNVAIQVSVIVLIAVGQTFVIITGGIDLSIGSNIAFSGLMAAQAIMLWNFPVWLGIIVGMVSGLVVGLINGLIVVYLNITPFIVTFVMQCVARGATYVMLNNKSSIFGLPPSFNFLGAGSIFKTELFQGLPMAVIIVVVITIMFGFLLAKTKTGRYTYAVGSNSEATRLSGIEVKSVIVKVYVISGLLAGITGVLAAARLGAATGTAGMNAELDAVASSVIGGTSLMGGEGMIATSFIGACIIGVLGNGLTLMDISGNWQLLAKGIVVLAAAALDNLKRTKKINLFAAFANVGVRQQQAIKEANERDNASGTDESPSDEPDTASEDPQS